MAGTDTRPAHPVPRGQRPPGRPPGGSPSGGGGQRGGRATAGDFSGTTRRLLSMLAPERWLMAGSLLVCAASVTLSVLGPKVLGRATDLIFADFVAGRLPAGQTTAEAAELLRARGHRAQADAMTAAHAVPGQGVEFTRIRNVLILAAAVYLVAALLILVQGRLTAVVVQRAGYRLRDRAEAKLARLPLAYFDRHPHGEVLSRVTNDIDNVNQSLQQTLSQIVNSVITVIAVLVVMCVISPLLAVIALVSLPASIYLAAAVGRRAQAHFRSQWAVTGRLNGHIEDMYTGHALVTVFGRQREAAATFREHNEALTTSSFRAQFVSGAIQPVMLFVGNLNYVLVAVVGALRVSAGALSIGDVQAFMQYSRQFSAPLGQMSSMANVIQSGVASAERVFALLDEPEQSPDVTPPARPDRVRGRVEFEDVSFSYTPGTPLIERLNLSVEPGQSIAVVGPTGAGKTTLVNLLMRFYEVDQGRILLDGVDIARMRRDELRSHIGMVLQDSMLFGGTIAQNIAYGAPGASREQIVQAARATHVDRFVRTLPQGYDTVLDEENATVSAGERQLITIARAFLADRAILVLDEATSSVDTRTEVLIQEAMHSLRQGRTSFVIAHRLSTIRDADTILVLDGGRIVERGTHDELIDAGGTYSRLYAAQFAETPAPVD
ncbi:ABC transporter ATP-binding protein [Micromonospora soli]|uniref:ABC transporter ATP-binding protein n=1 Tax=Micromonospora sp. NBRC 110009 TaxID=3061627 RepID=UPI0026715A0A|nr:ABC transporter ATP-binding protein [Micromonospora sp. NBRC 110009]WKU00436.1 ABC transporter ATP-binding protein [Micromonospora sp. NBRC 110009]